jgi:hypothetical protein
VVAIEENVENCCPYRHALRDRLCYDGDLTFLVVASLLWRVPWPTPSVIMTVVLSLTGRWFVFFVVYEHPHT